MPATLFDFNGVLVDDEAVHLACFRALVAPLGIELTDALYTERYLGFDDAGAFAAILEDGGRAPTTADVRALVEAKRPLYLAEARRGLRIFPGAVELVRRRAARGPVGIVSGALAEEIDLALDQMGVRALVGFVVAAEHVAACKPDPEGYVKGLAALGAGVAREQVVVIEDSVAGVQAAKRAGLRCAAVTHSYEAAELVRAGADLVVARLDDLHDEALDRLGGATR